MKDIFRNNSEKIIPKEIFQLVYLIKLDKNTFHLLHQPIFNSQEMEYPYLNRLKKINLLKKEKPVKTLS